MDDGREHAPESRRDRDEAMNAQPERCSWLEKRGGTSWLRRPRRKTSLRRLVASPVMHAVWLIPLAAAGAPPAPLPAEAAPPHPAPRPPPPPPPNQHLALPPP